MIILQFRGFQLFLTELLLSQYENQLVADFRIRAQQHSPINHIAVKRLIVNLVFDKVPNPVQFNVTAVRAQPDVRDFFYGGFRFAARFPPRDIIAPAEQTGSRIDVKSINEMPSAVAPFVYLSVTVNERMSLNHVTNVLEDVAASHLAVVEMLLHLAVDLIPWPADVFAQEPAQRAEQIRKV